MVADFNKKANREFFNSKLLFKVVGIIFLVGILVLISIDFKMYQKKQKLAAQINVYQKQIEDIKKSSQTLKDEIANSDNVDYLEKLAYEQLDQTRPGETEYMFVKSPKKTEATPPPQNFWAIFTGWFFGMGQWIKNRF